MKKKRIIFLLCLLTAVFFFSSCNVSVSDYKSDYDDHLKGTSWSRYGELLVFDSNTNGVLYVFDEKNDEAMQYSFTYTFDSYDYTGIITYDDFDNIFSDDTELFAIESHFGTNTLMLWSNGESFEYTEVDYRRVEGINHAAANI
jgi:hypothetical protein